MTTKQLELWKQESLKQAVRQLIEERNQQLKAVVLAAGIATAHDGMGE